MFILARGGQTYARLRISAGPGGDLILPVEVDFQVAFPAADMPACEADYAKNVFLEPDRLVLFSAHDGPSDRFIWPDDHGLVLDGGWDRPDLTDTHWEPINAPF